MKKLILPLLAALLCFAGCVTNPTTGKQVVDPAVTQSIATDAALLTGETLNAKYHDELVLTLDSLEAFVAAGGGNVADLQSALAHLPVGVLQGTNGFILTQGASILIHQGQALIVRLDKNEINKYYVLPVATGLRDGLRIALGRQSSITPSELYSWTERASVWHPRF